MVRALLLVFIAIGAFTLTWASSDEEEDKMKFQVILDRTGFFDTELLQELGRLPDYGNNNVMISPISVKLALGMLWEGASPSAAQEISQALRLPNSKEEVRHFFTTVLQSLQKKDADNNYTLDMANRLYVTNSVILNEPKRNNTNNQNHVVNRPVSSGGKRKPASSSSTPTTAAGHHEPSTTPTPTVPVIELDFMRAITNYYNAEATFLDFTKANEAAVVINGWASDVSHGLITNVIQPGSISPDTQLFLGNVVYFKGNWEHAFDPIHSKQGTFYLSDKTTFQTTMMEQLNYFKFGVIDSLKATALELPYAGNKFSMLILLPNEKYGINQMMRDLPHNPLNSIVAQLELEEVQVSIPKFEAEFNADIVGPLQNIGVSSVFETIGGGGLPGISRRISMKVDSIQHSVKIIVNELGTEAAAATGILVVPLMGGSMMKFEADHPFLFFIRDTETGGFLFGGKLSRPNPYIPNTSSHTPRPKPAETSSGSAPNLSKPKQGENNAPSSQVESSQRRSRMAYYPGLVPGFDEDRVFFEQ